MFVVLPILCAPVDSHANTFLYIHKYSAAKLVNKISFFDSQNLYLDMWLGTSPEYKSKFLGAGAAVILENVFCLV